MVCRFILYLSSSCQIHRAVKNSGNSAAGRRENNKRRLGSLVLIKLIWNILEVSFEMVENPSKNPQITRRLDHIKGKHYPGIGVAKHVPFFSARKAYSKWKEAKIIRKDPQRPHWSHWPHHIRTWCRIEACRSVDEDQYAIEACRSYVSKDDLMTWYLRLALSMLSNIYIYI